jgi:O-acetyl-ADP-ribose deacetylase (regulator of RNase III)
MIDICRGNMLKADAEAYVNTVNSVGVMGKGIALQFKKAFPDNYEAYRAAAKAGEVAPGRMFVYPTGRMVNPKFIVNFPTKRHWKENSKMEYIRSGLLDLVEQIRRLSIGSIAIPPLGCGMGGLSWQEVRPTIEKAFEELPDVRVLLYEPQDSPAASEMPVGQKDNGLTRARAMLIRLMDLYSIPGYKLSLLEVQKLAYFLQEAGEPLRLRYAKHKYGPYADNLNHVLQRLEGAWIVGYGDRISRAEIRSKPGAVEAAKSVLADEEDAAEIESRLRRVENLIRGYEHPYGLELLSSIHWIALHENPQAAVDTATALETFQRWGARKRERYRAEHIHKARERLQRQGWLDKRPVASSK